MPTLFQNAATKCCTEIKIEEEKSVTVLMLCHCRGGDH